MRRNRKIGVEIIFRYTDLKGPDQLFGPVANSGVGRTRDYADPSFTLCEPAEIRNRMRAAGSARIPSRHPRRRILCAATAWLQTPGSCVVPCERIEIRQSVAWVPADDPDQDGRISVTASEEVA